MPDLIKLLPDHVANQIAAGEVVQRPSSIVKELIENSIDAGATEITLLIKDGGSTLVQVIDNGNGMSDTDARMCWERHATSKIKKAEDLFELKTFGFRGEALASIAAVAQVEMKTKRNGDDAATFIRIEGSKVIEQSLIAAPIGTSISVKNLFYNIPARRNFLKSVSVETRHIMDEFVRQSLIYHEIGFSFYNNNQEVLKLPPTSFKIRTAEILSKGKEKDLLAVTENTDIVVISGYIGVPSLSKRTRGDQYLFVNKRFIKSAYFNHAIQQAFEGLIESDQFPSFSINLEIPPSRIDVNVHPTKTEVKFEDEKHIYNILKASIKKCLGSFVVSPAEDMFGMADINKLLNKNSPPTQNWGTQKSEHSFPKDFYNPFSHSVKPLQKNWNKIFEIPEETESPSSNLFHSTQEFISPNHSKIEWKIDSVFQLHSKYIVTIANKDLYIIDQHIAHELILYHTFKSNLQNKKGVSQQLLFPRTVELNMSLFHLAEELLPELGALGFDVRPFGGSTLIINGLPAELQKGDEVKILEQILEHYQNSGGDIKWSKHDSLAVALARQAAIASPSIQEDWVLQSIVEQLFELEHPFHSFDGKPVMLKIGIDFLYDSFKKQRI